MNKIFGYEYIVNASSCDLQSISSVLIVKLFIIELIDDIDMQLYYHENLKMQVHKYGNDKSNFGITGFAPILTSSITIHTVESTGNIYLNMFSCKLFNTNKVDKCIRIFFKPDGSIRGTFTRR